MQASTLANYFQSLSLKRSNACSDLSRTCFSVRIVNLLFHKLSPFIYFRVQGMFSENSKETSDPAEKYQRKLQGNK